MRDKHATARVFYGWWVVAAGLVIYATLLGCHQTFGIFFKPIQYEFGWSRAVTATAFFIAGITIAILSPIVGMLSDRYGPRIVITAVGLSGTIGYLLVSQVQTQWQFYSCFVLMGSGMTFFVPLQAVVSRWFTLRRGLALGLTGIGGGIGQALFPPVAQILIDRFGWRHSYLILAGLMGVVVISATQILRGSPREKGLLPYGEKVSVESRESQHPHNAPSVLRLNQVIHKKAFWMILLATCAGHFTYQMAWVHLVPYVTDPGIGVSSMVGASLMSTIGWSNMAGKIFMGNLSDRIGPRTTLLICYGMSGLAMLWLMVAKELWMLYLFSIGLGFFYGGGIPMQPSLVGAIFGLGSLGAVFGGVQTGTSAGGAIGSFLGGYIYDIAGSYYPAFLLGAILYFISTTLVALVRKPKEIGI